MGRTPPRNTTKAPGSKPRGKRSRCQGGGALPIHIFVVDTGRPKMNQNSGRLIVLRTPVCFQPKTREAYFCSWRPCGTTTPFHQTTRLQATQTRTPPRLHARPRFRRPQDWRGLAAWVRSLPLALTDSVDEHGKSRVELHTLLGTRKRAGREGDGDHGAGDWNPKRWVVLWWLVALGGGGS